jgi:DNA/RNA-binding domain of Phe-tRNA-synthetase-like protein
MDDALHNVKKGDELGKGVKQIVSKQLNKVKGYQAFTKDSYYISNTEKNALQRVKDYADEFRSINPKKGKTKYTAEAMFQDPDFKEFFKEYLNKRF